MEQAINLARAGGRVVYLGGNWEGLTIGPATPFALKEVDLVPSIAYGRVGPSRDIDVAASILAERPSIAEALITHRFPLDAAGEAFAAARDRASSKAIKVVVEP